MDTLHLSRRSVRADGGRAGVFAGVLRNSIRAIIRAVAGFVALVAGIMWRVRPGARFALPADFDIRSGLVWRP